MTEVVVVVRDEQALPVDEDVVGAAAAAAVRNRLGARASGCEVSLVLATEDAIRRLNLQYRDADRATDVLAFPQAEPFAAQAGELLGDVVVCPAVVACQAQELGRPERDELLEVVVHGVLHLIGYTDDSEEARAGMFEIQAEVLSELADEGARGPHV